MIQFILKISFILAISVIVFCLAWDFLSSQGVICKILGHKPQEKVYSGAEYMKVVPGTVDGIGRHHATLYARCARCEKKYRAGQIHIPKDNP